MNDYVFELVETKEKDNGVIVEKYKPKCDLYITSFNMKDATFERKKIIEYSVHKNIDMYYVYSQYFKTFWVSSDHSIIVYDVYSDSYKPETPRNILKERTRYALVRKDHDGNIQLIPADTVNIVFDPYMKTGYDLTVEDNYTFLTADGVVVQDTVAIYDIHKEIGKISNLRIEYSLIDPNFRPFTLDHEFVLAIYQLTKHDKGRDIVSKILNMKITKPLSKSDLDEIMMTLAINRSASECIKIYSKLSKLVTYANTTLSLEDFDFPFADEEKEILNNLEHKSSEEQVKILQELTLKYGKKNPHLADIVDSGSRGKWIQIQQVSVAKGVTVDARNQIVGFIKSSYLQGLSEDEQLIAVHGTRKGLLDTATKTADSGYLTRQLVYALVDRKVDLNTADCKTSDTITVDITDKKIANAFRLRVMKTPEGDKIITNINDILGKQIEVYSPLTCNNDKYCIKCCGGLVKFLNTEYVGVIAAQSIGERTTQLVLRSFHVSGTAERLDSNAAAHDMVTDLNSLQQLLQYNKNIDQLRLLEILRNSFVKTYGIQHLWIEILVHALYRDENMKVVKLGENGNKIALRDIPAIHWLNGLVFGWSKQRLGDGIRKGFKIEELSPFAKLLFI